jgi:hypothetical protein
MFPKLILKYFIVISIVFTVFVENTFAQKKNENVQIHIRKAQNPIVIDGKLDEADWQRSEVATDFMMVTPFDTSKGNVKTEARILFDDRNVYVSAVCYEKKPGPIVVESFRRDWNFGKNDNFIVFIDTFDDRINGFAFGVNAAGAQWDGLMFDGGSVNLNWDCKWETEVKHYGDRWVFEAAIPFKTIRYNETQTRWGINFSRLDLKAAEKSAWAPVPRQFPSASLSHSGVLLWDVPPPKAGANIAVIPYVLGGLSKNFNPDKPATYKNEAGFDAKIVLNSALNLDLTVNPDFSQVDVDRQVINIDRFEIFYPERRQYFLENGDLFNNLGLQSMRPFFSRRIGQDGVPIQFGARLSGKLDQNWRIGVMDMQTAKRFSPGSVDANIPSQNFAVIALQRQVFGRSSLVGYFINKESIGLAAGDYAARYRDHNRNLGLEFNLASSNNIWRGKALYHKSFSPHLTGDDYAFATTLTYATTNWFLYWQHESIGKNYNPEVGYLQRPDGYTKIVPRFEYNHYPKSTWILNHGPQGGGFVIWNANGELVESEQYFGYGMDFLNRASANIWVGGDYVKLQQEFDPTNNGNPRQKLGSEHRWWAWGTEFTSKPTSVFTYSFSTRYGGYYADGTRLGISTDLGYRIQPYFNLTINTNYNDIRIPNYPNTTFWLVGPRFDFTFTNKLFFTTYVQYNEQARNINLYSRLQWRYKPASDLFVVYADNYTPEFGVKDRFVVLKLNYWWNL